MNRAQVRNIGTATADQVPSVPQFNHTRSGLDRHRGDPDSHTRGSKSSAQVHVTKAQDATRNVARGNAASLSTRRQPPTGRTHATATGCPHRHGGAEHHGKTPHWERRAESNVAGPQGMQKHQPRLTAEATVLRRTFGSWQPTAAYRPEDGIRQGSGESEAPQAAPTSIGSIEPAWRHAFVVTLPGTHCPHAANE